METEFFEQYYGLVPEKFFQLGKYQAFREKNIIYIMIPVFEGEQEEIEERFELSEYMRNIGEKYVPAFLLSKQGKYIHGWDHQFYILLRLDLWREVPFQRPGRRLAKFHYRGMFYNGNSKVLNRLGQWKELWEKRLEQIEKMWQSVVMNRPASEFEILFAESFPYYAGLSENAIQYFVDTTIDDMPGQFDAGTICYERFTNQSWRGQGQGPIIWKNPFEWIVDHPTRDLAEYAREMNVEHTRVYRQEMHQFFKQYQSVLPLSSFSWRLLYSRLILPLHYFQCIERYYSSTSETYREQLYINLKRYTDRSDDYEQFLYDFYEVNEVSVRSMNIPKLDWLKSTWRV